MYYTAKCGHIACSLSCLDIINVIFNQKTKDDVFIMSKGHAAGALYVVLNDRGEISDEMLTTFYRDGTKLAGHPSVGTSKEIPFALGSLGHGLPIATGIAYSNKLNGNRNKTFVLMSDGETNEGTTWESAHFAVRHSLDNLVVVVDKNGLQGFGTTADVLGDTANPLVWGDIGFRVIECDGHNDSELQTQLFQDSDGRPTIVLANTIKGFGVPFMENKLEWHYLSLDSEKFEEAMDYLNGVQQ